MKLNPAPAASTDTENELSSDSSSHSSDVMSNEEPDDPECFIKFRLAGSSFQPSQDNVREFRSLKDQYKRENLTLVREPHNAIDKNAITVQRLTGEVLGYVPLKHIPRVSKAMMENEIISVKAENILGHYVMAAKEVVFHKVIVVITKLGLWAPASPQNKYNSHL